MKSNLIWPVFCLSLLCLQGCAPITAKGGHPPAPVVVAVHADNAILAYALRYGALPADEQKKEYAVVMQSLNSNKTDLTSRMKAALALALPGSRQRDNGRALALLDEIQRDGNADADTKAIAALLKEYVSERQKLEENAAKLGQKSADEQKRADALQLKADGLQQKLDELKNIEKALTTRDQGKLK